MSFPHQILPIVAVVDMITAIGASIHLGLVPLPQSLTVQGQSMLNHFFARLRGTSPAFASHRIIVELSNPKKLLVWMLALCILRCIVIVLVWSSVKEGIQAGRVRNRSEDYSGRAILYSAVCVLSILMNLSNLNTLFQTRGAPPDASLSTILLHMSASSLAAEQLIVSGFEWLLFVIVAGTHGLSAGGSDPVDSRPTSQVITNAGSETVIEEVTEAAPEQVKTIEAPAVPDKTETQKQKKDYGSLTDLQPPAYPQAEVKPTKSAPIHPNTDGPVPSSSTTSIGDSPDESAVSSDIVDIPTDRKASAIGAKERLNRARENGKVRRRSLWKKIRGKGGDEGTSPQTAAA